jgi:hypothetical protein
MSPSVDSMGTCVVSSCNIYLSMVLHHGTLGSYRRDDLHEGGEGDVTCLLACSSGLGLFASLSSLLLPVYSTAFFVINIMIVLLQYITIVLLERQ